MALVLQNTSVIKNLKEMKTIKLFAFTALVTNRTL
jgi:hypothetical protein